ncbi:MAG TPA: DUF2188 domain-containing protein [Propionicimonas sp.]
MAEQRHVVPNKDRGGWDVKADGAQRSSGHFDRQSDAIDRAREILERNGGGELATHNQQGEIRAKDTIKPAHDPRDIPG